MAAHTTHHPIALVNSIGITTIASARHTTGDHPVGKGSEINTKKLRSPLNAGWLYDWNQNEVERDFWNLARPRDWDQILGEPSGARNCAH
ncbi:hypothetical protein [Nostoc sp.]|uniref:hypothetical protein n=1 Tax=Nostoc sp. TaxID=1180 RepID=UPI002FF9BA6D